MVKRHAHIYRDSLTCQVAFKDFSAGFGYHRSDSGMWYACHDETHNFFAATQTNKLLRIDWDTINMAKDVDPSDRANILFHYTNNRVKSTTATQANLTIPSARRFLFSNTFICRVKVVGSSLLGLSFKKDATEAVTLIR